MTVSQNCLIGAINAANNEANKIQNVFTGAWGGVPEIAAQYRDQHKTGWVVIGDENYGETGFDFPRWQVPPC